jgi:hypothetical protein
MFRNLADRTKAAVFYALAMLLDVLLAFGEELGWRG